MRKLTLLALTLIASFPSFAQTDSTTTRNIPHPRYEQYIGVQINELVQQVLNFNNSGTTNTVNNNPYLLVYSVNSVKSGWGIRLGVGFSSNTNSSNDGITQTNNNITDMHFRLGIEKAFRLSAKWSAGVGLDGLYNNNNDKTTNTISSTDTTTTTTKTKIYSYGGGAMGWLRYYVNKRILIGTESSFYYTAGKQNETIQITSRNFNLQTRPVTTNTTATSNDTKQGVFSVPVTLYLILKF
jgi:hypothetical protein